MDESTTIPVSKYYTCEKTIIADEIPSGDHSVLEIGCAAGRLGKKLRHDKKAKIIIGVELFKSGC